MTQQSFTERVSFRSIDPPFSFCALSLTVVKTHQIFIILLPRLIFTPSAIFRHTLHMMSTHRHTHTQTYTHAHTHMQAHVHTHTHSRTSTHTHTNTQTNTTAQSVGVTAESEM